MRFLFHHEQIKHGIVFPDKKWRHLGGDIPYNTYVLFGVAPYIRKHYYTWLDGIYLAWLERDRVAKVIENDHKNQEY